MITTMGTCPSPGRYCADTLTQSLWDYLTSFTLLAREIGSCNGQTESTRLSRKISQLQMSLPEAIRFNTTWLDRPTSRSTNALDVHAAYLHQRTHDFLISLYHPQMERRTSSKSFPGYLISEQSLCEENFHHTLQSCREVLYVFQFFRRCASRAIACWTTCQQAYRAATLLIRSSTPSMEPENFDLVYQTYKTLSETSRVGAHTLGQVLAEKLGCSFKKSRSAMESQSFARWPLVLQNSQHSNASLSCEQANAYHPEQSIWPEIEQLQFDCPGLQAGKAPDQRVQGRSRSKVPGDRNQSFGAMPSSSMNNPASHQNHPKRSTARDVAYIRPSHTSSKQAGATAKPYADVNLLPVASQACTTSAISSVPAVKREAAAYDAPLDLYTYQDIEANTKAWGELGQTSPTVSVPMSTTYLDTSIQQFAMDLDGPQSSPEGGHSNTSSGYTHSNASSLHTPLGSNSVSPVGSYEHASKTYCLNDASQPTSGETMTFETGAIADVPGVLTSNAQHSLTLEEMQSCASRVHWPSESIR